MTHPLVGGAWTGGHLVNDLDVNMAHDDTRSITSGGTILSYPPNHERLLTELESSEGQLGAIIRYTIDLCNLHLIIYIYIVY